MRERKPLRSQVDSLSFTLTENGRALYQSDITCVRSKIIFSPEFNVAISVGMHRQKHKCKSVFTQHNSINVPICRGGLAIGKTGSQWPGSQFGPLPCIYLFFI